MGEREGEGDEEYYEGVRHQEKETGSRSGRFIEYERDLSTAVVTVTLYMTTIATGPLLVGEGLFPHSLYIGLNQLQVTSV